jgi:hypothetical protein
MGREFRSTEGARGREKSEERGKGGVDSGGRESNIPLPDREVIRAKRVAD